MITLITGAPGAGKTACLVSLLQGLAKGRAVYVDGIPDLKFPHEELTEPLSWHNTVPDGSVIVIDEVQRVWRARGPGQKVPDSVAALETHRHRGLDFYIITQMPRLVDSNVRALVGRHIHLRDIGYLGRWWYEWTECQDQCNSAWKNAPIKKRYRLPKRIFGEYKSATEHIKPVRSFPWMLAVLVLAIIGTGWFAWSSYTMIMAKSGMAGGEQLAIEPYTGGVVGEPVPLYAQPETIRSDYIDDRVDWIPRQSDRPESAPAFDHLRVVRSMPVVVGAVCSARGCVCYTQQGTDAGLTDHECRQWFERRPFDPYRDPTASVAQQGASVPAATDGAAGDDQRSERGASGWVSSSSGGRSGAWPL